MPPELGTVRRLVERGHRVTVLAEDSMVDDVRTTGATYRPWTEAPNRPSRRPEHDPWASRRSRPVPPARRRGPQLPGTGRSTARAAWRPTVAARTDRIATSWPFALARSAPTVQLSLPPSAVNGS